MPAELHVSQCCHNMLCCQWHFIYVATVSVGVLCACCTHVGFPGDLSRFVTCSYDCAPLALACQRYMPRVCVVWNHVCLIPSSCVLEYIACYSCLVLAGTGAQQQSVCDRVQSCSWWSI